MALTSRFAIGLLVSATGLAVAHPAAAQNAVNAENLVIDPPTLHAVGFAWFVSGDANWNATASLEYRPQGTSEWRAALPLLRVENAQIGPVHPGNLLAGSVFDLVPATAYEFRLVLSDPDGGGAEQMVTAVTRAEPPVTSLTNVRHVAPGNGGGSGSESDPFLGLSAADAAAQPGDVFLLAPGTYAPVAFSRSGTAGAPISYRGADRDTVVIDGNAGTSAVVNASDREYLVLENLTVQNSQTGIVADDSVGVVLRGLVVHQIQRFGGDPIAIRLGGGATNGYVCDNYVFGPELWGQRISDSYGVKVSGSGHVVCNNRIEHFWDNIGMANSGGENAAISLDIVQNLLLNATDDGVETDYSQRNVRVLRNRIANSLKGVTAQPVFGGPIYFIRNEIYNTDSSPYKFHMTGGGWRPSGLLVYHNTTAVNGRAFSGGEWFNGHFRNNLFYGSSGYVMETLGAAASFDYDGWAPKQTPVLKLNDVRYDTINAACGNPAVEDFCGSTGNEQHAITISRDDWLNVAEPAGWSGAGPTPADGWDFTLSEGSGAVDSAVLLPNINDGYQGAGPDRGALERGGTTVPPGPRRDPDDPLPPVDGGMGGTSSDAGASGSGGSAGSSSSSSSEDGDAGCACRLPRSGRGSGFGAFAALLLALVARARRTRAHLARP